MNNEHETQQVLSSSSSIHILLQRLSLGYLQNYLLYRNNLLKDCLISAFYFIVFSWKWKYGKKYAENPLNSVILVSKQDMVLTYANTNLSQVN